MKARRPLQAGLVALSSLLIVAPVFSQAVFRDVAARAGIDFEHPASPEVGSITEAANGGVALLDYNRDGLLDIYLVGSLTVETASDPEKGPSALYVSRGGGRFEDVAREAGVALPGWGSGVCVADYDGDGFQDLYVTGVGRNRLFRNLGGERFTDVAREARVAAGSWSTGCAFADFDRDGDLDLFVSRYVGIDRDGVPEFTEGTSRTCVYRGMPVHCGPQGLVGMPDLFFRNEGDGRFREIGRRAGLTEPSGHYGLGAVWLDADEDGWLDLFVANDTQANFLYLNRRDGTFEEMGLLMGVALNEDGGGQGSMGIAVGDYRNEGRMSLFVTNYADEYNALYRNAGGFFTDVSFSAGTALSSLRYVGWGTSFLDYDNDGFLDLLLVNGHVYPQTDLIERKEQVRYPQRRLLYRGRSDGTFAEVGEGVGGPVLTPRVSRGIAVGDLDNDGRLDVVVNNLVGKAEVWRNVAADTGNWLLVQLAGAGKMTDAVGATVRVRVGETQQMRLVQSGSSYLSQDDMRLHFGLGSAAVADLVEVLWPDGTTMQRTRVTANQVLVLEQGEGEGLADEEQADETPLE